MRALVIEDDATNRELLKVYLGPYAKCNLTPNGRDGLSAFENSLKDSSYFDLVCLDIMMPGIDGLQVLERLRELENNYDVPLANRAKVIMLTAVAEKDIVMRAFKSGCESYLIKPLIREELLHQLSVFKLVRPDALADASAKE